MGDSFIKNEQNIRNNWNENNSNDNKKSWISHKIYLWKKQKTNKKEQVVIKEIIPNTWRS